MEKFKEPLLKCRVCWEEKTNDVLILVSTPWAPESQKTIKDIILFCVPTLSIEDTSQLCKTCLWQLKFTYHFIDRCLKTETIMKETTNIIQNCNLNSNQSSKLEYVKCQRFEEGIENPMLVKGDKDSLNIDGVQSYDHTYFNSANERVTDKSSPMEICKVDIVVKQEKEIAANLDNEDDSDNCNGNDDWFDEAFADSTEDNVDKKKDEPEKDTENEPPVSVTKEDSESQYSPVLVNLLDMAPINLRCITVKGDISDEQREEMIQDGMNLLNMSTDPTKKKRVLYLTRDLFMMPDNNFCKRCNITFNTRCDFADHRLQHRRGKICWPSESAGVSGYSCDKCSAILKTNRQYREHYKLEHGHGSPHQCSKCSKRFRFLKDLERHQEFFKDKDKCLVSCSKCSKTFTSTRQLENHEADVADAPCCDYWKCNVCSKKFTKEGFQEHCKEHVNFLCPDCGKSFYTSQALSAHTKMVHTKTRHMCHKCGQIMKTVKLLQFHMNVIHGNDSFICDKCPRQFKSQLYLRKHARTHVANKPKSFACEQCPKAFHSKTILRNHILLLHLAPAKFVCPTCGEGFVRKDYLKRHLSSHEKYMQYTCPVCKKSFASEVRLAHHASFGHDENGKPLQLGWRAKSAVIKKKYATKNKEPCVCNICNKVLAGQISLKLHYKTHLKIREFKCDICELTFQTPSSYKNHMKKHEDPNFKFSCNICHNSKSSQQELDAHVQKVHKNLKYKCTYCPKKFGRKYLLYSHESMKHTDEYAKKEDLYKILVKQEAVKAPKSSWSNKRRGVKLGAFTDNVHQVLDQLARTNPETVEQVRSNFAPPNRSSKVKVDVIQQPTTSSQLVSESNFDIWSEEYQMTEEDRACEALEEDMDSDE